MRLSVSAVSGTGAVIAAGRKDKSPSASIHLSDRPHARPFFKEDQLRLFPGDSPQATRAARSRCRRMRQSSYPPTNWILDRFDRSLSRSPLRQVLVASTYSLEAGLAICTAGLQRAAGISLWNIPRLSKDRPDSIWPSTFWSSRALRAIFGFRWSFTPRFRSEKVERGFQIKNLCSNAVCLCGSLL